MLAIGSDHAGFALKQHLLSYLKAKGIPYRDVGCFDEQSVDYPLIARAACDLVLDGSCELCVLICGTGVGISMAANKIRGIRCALCSDAYSARMTRAHNNANALALGGRVIGPALAEDILSAFLTSQFEGERHQRRIDLLEPQ